MGTPERSGSTERFSSMSVPERLSVDPEDLARVRKNSDLSNSDNVSLELHSVRVGCESIYRALGLLHYECDSLCTLQYIVYTMCIQCVAGPPFSAGGHPD